MTEMKIIDRIDPDMVQSELTPDRMLRKTNKGDNEIYVVDRKSVV